MMIPEARWEALGLVEAYDGSAHEVVEERLAARLADDDVDDALRLDQVRREIEQVYEETGEG